MTAAQGVAAAPRPLTARQGEIFLYIWQYVCSHGYQPTYREVAAHFGFTSQNGVHAHIRFIMRKGWLVAPRGENRAIRFLFAPDGNEFRGFRPIED